ncbi:MAG TPA: glycosyltransferase [Candidatus Elarobacter sp.]|nr:glycosyltransferase [Candidatus Elarobacter sp.]
MAESPSLVRRLLNRLRRAAGRRGGPENPPGASAPARGVDESALADWRRYAAELERLLDDPARVPAPPPVLRYEILPPPPGAAGSEGAAAHSEFEFELSAGAPSGPLVTVIIPVYDDVEMTASCLRSLAEFPPARARAEYVLVDDASPSDVAGRFTGIRGLTVLRNAENLGFLRTCNRAARLSSADYVMLLNNDTLVRAGWLDELVETAERDPRAGVVGAKLVYPSGRLQEAGSIVWRDANGWNFGRGQRADDPAYEFVRDVDYCSGAALLVRRSVWNRVGGFDERFAPAYYEDTDLCFAARRAGYRVVYQPRSVVVHLEGGSGGTDTGAGVKRHQALNHPVFREKWREVLDAEHPVHDAADVPRAARRHQGSRTVLIIDNYVPEPDRDAGSNRMVQMMRIMRELGYHVIFFPDNFHGSQPYTENLQRLGVEVLYHIEGGPSPDERLREALDAADVVRVARPDIFTKYRRRLEARPALPVIYDTIDLHYVRLARELEVRGDAATADDRRRQRETKELELEIARSVDVTLTVTEIEKRILESEGIDNVHVVPLIHEKRKRTLEFEQTDGLLFIGGYNHTPNVDAVEWLVHEIMPLVWEEFPSMRVTLLGSNPPRAVWDLARDPRVAVTGYVADVEPHFQAARVFVAPLRFGAGLKGKIAHSLEYGLPVVTTPVGAEGFEFTDGRDALIADDAPRFAAAVQRLYADRVLWTRMSGAGAARLAPFYPERVKESIAASLDDAIARRRQRLAEPAPV